MTAAEYLELDSSAAYKSEFFHGEMFARSGGSIGHAAIGGNICHALRNLLKGTNCKPFNSDICIVDGVLNPVALFEVLSPTTERHDRGAKFRSYQTMVSLREYFLVSQDKALVERFERQSDGKWILSYHEGLDATVPIASVSCELALRDIYEAIVFEPNQ